MAIAPDTPFFFDPYHTGPRRPPLVMPATPRVAPRRESHNGLADVPMPATGNGTSGERENGATEDGGDSGLPSWVLPAMLAYGAAASIKQGSAVPLVSGITGYLGGRAEREQREAEAEAALRKDAREQALAESLIDYRRQQAQPEYRFSRGGFTGSFRPEPVPESVFGQPWRPEAREQEEQDRLTKGFATLEAGFNALPVERFSRPFQSGGQFFRADPETGGVELAPGSPGPTIDVLGRDFPDTPEGHEAALEWTRQRSAAGRAGGGGSGGGSTADMRAEARELIGRMFPGGSAAIRALPDADRQEVWDNVRLTLQRQFRQLSPSELNSLTAELVGPRPKEEEEVEDDLDLGFED